MTRPKFYKATLSVDKMQERGFNDKTSVGKLFDEMGARDWVVARETGAGGYKHYQCYVEFKSGKDHNSLINAFAGLGRIEPAHVHNAIYEIKDGDYLCKSDEALMDYANIQLRQWQGQLVAEIGDQNDRQITVLIDEDGGKGKTTLTKYLEVNHILKACPVLSNNAQEYVSYCMATPRNGYVFDLPRSDSIKDKNGLWKALERIKDGHLYEPRYHVQETWIKPPKVLVFTNETEIPYDKLSHDRWRVYTLDDSFGELSLRRVAYEE